jgi:hypothetical protein
VNCLMPIALVGIGLSIRMAGPAKHGKCLTGP